MKDIYSVIWTWFVNGEITHDQILAGATVFVAIFTMVLAYLARRQIKLTKILERAYISVRPFGIETFRTKDNVVCLVAIRNSGRTPARKVSWVLCRKWDTEQRIKRFQINKTDLLAITLSQLGKR